MADSTNSLKNAETELTMCDVLQEEQELEEDANAVLGGSDDTNCSYDKGYVPRQALYACTTCSVNAEPGGICLACCYACHDGHEVVELYTKRNFRCDCGNGKFPGKACTLRPGKEPLNSRNKYNQNFTGVYCSCSRPYPDLDDDTPDEMIQCVMCEDWYHGRHIGCEIPEDYFEMICSKCMESHKFLYAYLNKYHYVKVDEGEHAEKDKKNGIKKLDTESDIECDKKSIKKEPDSSEIECKESIKKECDSSEIECKESIKKECDSSEIECKESSSRYENDQKNTSVEEGIKEPKEVKKENVTVKEEIIEDCILKKLQVPADAISSGAAFWPENWRKELCHCMCCMNLYRENECMYLLNPDDTIQSYEERGKGKASESQYDKGLSALSQLDRVKQMEAIRAYTSMKGQLKEYLKQFADNKRTVCESDIKEFFERISKRQKLNNGVPHFCR